MKWINALNDYKLYLKIERGLSENSIDNYALDVKKLISYLEENTISTSPLLINKDIVKEFIYAISKTVNPRSQSRIISGLKGFFNYLIFEDYRQDNPLDTIDSPKTGRKLPDTINEDEVNELISAIDLSKPQGERNRAILEVLYGCGLRVSELTNLKVSDLFFDEGFIKVHGKGNKERFIPIVDITKKYINIYRKEVRNHLNIENGADLRAIQLMLGHESITTTEIYMHVDRSHLKEVINSFHPRK